MKRKEEKNNYFIAFFLEKKKCKCSTLLLQSHRHETFTFQKEASRRTEFPVLYSTSRTHFTPPFISVQLATPPTSNDGKDLIQLQQNFLFFAKKIVPPTSEAAFINGKETTFAAAP